MMITGEEAKTVKELEGHIIALDFSNLTAKIKLYGVWEPVSFSIRIYTAFNSRINELTDSLATCLYDDYDVPIQRVRIGVNKDNELIRVKKLKTWQEEEDIQELKEKAESDGLMVDE